ncbi:MAG: NAD(+) diphosphatase [Spirochaetaceae bacterium]|jgi:NAD+ diphosphatase|nr:NAD(+) diphosphatase [Spirochaetaceae bacterium]
MTPSRCLVFRGAELILPPEGAERITDERIIIEGIPLDTVYPAFRPEDIKRFDVPAADRSAVLPCFSLVKNAATPLGWRNIPLRTLISGLAVEDASGLALVFRACHILQWLSESRFCGSCGSENTVDDLAMTRLCPACGRVEYPRVSPAVIVRITNENGEILLAHDKKFKEKIYSLIAGFYEAGERLEDTVEREIFEEVALSVKNIRYIASQSWPFPNSLMIGFSADYSHGEIRCDGVEIEDAGWFNRENLPPLPGHGSIARFLIEEWRGNAPPLRGGM